MKTIKKTILIVAAIISMATAFSSCDFFKVDPGEQVWDVAPILIQFEVKDMDGKNLVKPDRKGLINGKRVKAIWQETEYYLDSADTAVETKAYKPYFIGLATHDVISSETNYEVYPYKYTLGIVFGELDGAKDYDNDLVIDWGDGKKDIFHIYRKFEWGPNGEPQVDGRITLNGEEYFRTPVIVK